MDRTGDPARQNPYCPKRLRKAERAWQVYDELDYFLLYGSFETDRNLGAFYKGCGYTVRGPGEGFLLERFELPFGIHAGPAPCVFTRWRPPC
ncbi:MULTISPECIES: hypothetical protein [unclassified Streptomyces]|uniref:hypothetical protein n=1 Tax=unclassified Streptomyces TaxID=2593676 RepID=UPI0036EAD59E